jgi:signal transduction histidine kinase
VTGSALEQVLRGQTVYREDMSEQIYPEEGKLADLGLRSRVATPLLIGPRAIGMLSIARDRPSSFTSNEVELASLLGRLVATAVQNIRAYESERATVGELTRLSSLRADFVSLVSHELRSPMAAVLGASQTLLQRWRELAPEQRESFLSLIADETSRLSDLVSDVLDTSRIDAGTFPYTFADVDLEELAREVAAAGELAQDEVRVRAVVRAPLPIVHGDRERLRQVLINLVDNAVKYSPAGGEVELKAASANGQILVEVTDRGPGIAREDHEVIFEKFGRAKGGLGRPGTGLGLFIARSITEAHGGELVVRSSPERGATFSVTLPGRGF